MMDGGDHDAVAGASCSAIRSRTSCCPSASRLVVGSSRSHNTAFASNTPASATRRFWPADSMRTARSAKALAPVRVRAASISAARDGAADADGILQVFARRQIAFERRLMPEIGELGMEFIARARAPARRARTPALPRDRAARRWRGCSVVLPAPFLPVSSTHCPGAALEAHAAQHMTIAAPQVDALNGQHGVRHGVGAPGRNRTGMALRPTDFKSVASTNSATGACRLAARVVDHR